MENFQELDLPEKLRQALDAMNFTTPTPIQAQTIPVSMRGEDVLGTAQTGTGKTGAFAIPLAAKLLSNPQESLVVLTPTRELATQVETVFRSLLAFERSIKTALLIGGESIDRQFRQLRNRPRVIVGTPGRVNDHIKRRTLDLRQTRSLVLDETDLMLDMGFDVQIETIIAELPKDRQTLMFSATLPRQIEGLASRYLTAPVRVSVGQQSAPGEGIEQQTVMLQEADKYSQLLDQLDKRAGSVIIFVKTKRGADKLSAKLNDEDHAAAAIHGDLRQSKRDMVLNGFRREKYRIMVATDVAARGIDVPHIRHVINYDLPQCPEDYIHRIGRTGRAGEKGSAVSFVTRSDRGKWSAIERLMDPNAKEENRGGGRGEFTRRNDRGNFRSDSRGNDRRDDRGGFQKKSWGDRDGGNRSNDRNFDRRDDRKPFNRDGAKPSFGQKSFDKKPFDKKPWGDRAPDRAPSRRDDWDANRFEDRKPMNREGGKPGFAGKSFDKKPWGDKGGDKNGNRFEPRQPDRDGNRKSFGRDSAPRDFGDRYAPAPKGAWREKGATGRGDFEHKRPASGAAGKPAFGGKKAGGFSKDRPASFGSRNKPAFGGGKPGGFKSGGAKKAAPRARP